MSQERIRAFLSLPGVEGVGLVLRDENNPLANQLYLCWKYPLQNETAMQLLMLQIRENLVTLPEQVDFLEFQTLNYFVYLYGLAEHLHLLVLVNVDSKAIKVLAARQLSSALRANLKQAIAAFEQQAGARPDLQARETSALGSTQEDPAADGVPPKSQIKVEDLLQAINHVARCSSKYLGHSITVNYLQACRPDLEWLQQFQVHNTPEITFAGAVTDVVSQSQLEEFQQWMDNFIRRCSLIITNFAIQLDPQYFPSSLANDQQTQQI